MVGLLRSHRFLEIIWHHEVACTRGFSDSCCQNLRLHVRLLLLVLMEERFAIAYLLLKQGWDIKGCILGAAEDGRLRDERLLYGWVEKSVHAIARRHQHD